MKFLNIKRSIGLLIICFFGLNLCYATNTEYQPTQEDILQKAQIDIAGNIAYQKEVFEKLYNYLLKLKTCSIGIYEIPNPASSTIPSTNYHIKGWEDDKCVVEITQKAPDLGGLSESKLASVTITCKYSQKTLESLGSKEELEKIRKGELDLSGRSSAMEAAMTECTVKINNNEN